MRLARCFLASSVVVLAGWCTAFAQLPLPLPGNLSKLSIECKTGEIGQDVVNHPYYLATDREHHETVDVAFHNMAGTAANVVAAVFFLSVNSSSGHHLQVSKPVLKDLQLDANSDAQWTVNSPTYKEHVDNSWVAGSGERSGQKPSGWIMGCIVNGTFYPVQASSEGLMDYAQSDEFKQQAGANSLH
jgi:hypothetical protein